MAEALEAGAAKEGGKDNPATKLLDFAKDVPWYYWLGGTLAGGALLLGALKGRQNSAKTADPGLPQAYTTSPLDFATQTGTADGGGGGGFVPPGSGVTPPMPGPPAPPGDAYIVHVGDTLDNIAKRYKVPGGWHAIYQNNEATIKATAAKYGHTANAQNYIYQGEQLYIPKA